MLGNSPITKKTSNLWDTDANIKSQKKLQVRETQT